MIYIYRMHVQLGGNTGTFSQVKRLVGEGILPSKKNAYGLQLMLGLLN